MIVITCIMISVIITFNNGVALCSCVRFCVYSVRCVRDKFPNWEHLDNRRSTIILSTPLMEWGKFLTPGSSLSLFDLEGLPSAFVYFRWSWS